MQEALVTLGFTEYEAKIIVFLKKSKQATQRDMERACDMRQPVVSVSLSSLKKQGIVTYVETPDGRAARPLKVYSLVNHMIIKDGKDKIESDYKEKCAAINTVEKCIHDNL
jgi:predicted transcriptional regulator